MKEYRLVPQEDLDDLEASRQRLKRYIKLSGMKSIIVSAVDVDQAIYKVTHKRYGKAHDMAEPDQVAEINIAEMR